MAQAAFPAPHPLPEIFPPFSAELAPRSHFSILCFFLDYAAAGAELTLLGPRLS